MGYAFLGSAFVLSWLFAYFELLLVTKLNLKGLALNLPLFDFFFSIPIAILLGIGFNINGAVAGMAMTLASFWTLFWYAHWKRKEFNRFYDGKKHKLWKSTLAKELDKIRNDIEEGTFIGQILIDQLKEKEAKLKKELKCK